MKKQITTNEMTAVARLWRLPFGTGATRVIPLAGPQISLEHGAHWFVQACMWARFFKERTGEDLSPAADDLRAAAFSF